MKNPVKESNEDKLNYMHKKQLYI